MLVVTSYVQHAHDLVQIISILTMPLLPFQYNFHRSLIGHLSLEYSTNAEVIEFVIYADLDLD